jgi:predicted RNA-binding Zn-ribbon protein involved in translation (DUF1610 family)
MEITTEQKHNIFKREVSAMLLESASWRDRDMEDYKTISIEDFLSDYIFDGILYDCLEKDEDYRVGEYIDYIDDFNVIRDSLWYSGAIRDYYNEHRQYDLHYCYDYFTETLTEYCIECDTEVELKTELRMQVCPNCGKPIAPCGICDMDFVKCSQCPIGCNSLAR